MKILLLLILSIILTSLCINQIESETNGTNQTNQNILGCSTCPEPTAWGDCIDNQQKRTNYNCSELTNYSCKSYVEIQPCKQTYTVLNTTLLEVKLVPEKFIGNTPSETKENIIDFLNSTDLEIVNLSKSYVQDYNIIEFIIIWQYGINSAFIETAKKDPLVSNFSNWAYVVNVNDTYRKEGYTYKITFKEGIYNNTLLDFVNKYPQIKDNLEVDYFAIPLQAIGVNILVPKQKTDEYIEILEKNYPEMISEAKIYTMKIA